MKNGLSGLVAECFAWRVCVVRVCFYSRRGCTAERDELKFQRDDKESKMDRTLFTTVLLLTAILSASVADAALVTYTLDVGDPNGAGTWNLKAAVTGGSFGLVL